MTAASGMFQQSIDKIFKDLPNVFCIADNTLIEGFDADSRDHDITLRWVTEICNQENFTQKYVSFQVNEGAILLEDSITKWSAARPSKPASAY